MIESFVEGALGALGQELMEGVSANYRENREATRRAEILAAAEAAAAERRKKMLVTGAAVGAVGGLAAWMFSSRRRHRGADQGLVEPPVVDEVVR